MGKPPAMKNNKSTCAVCAGCVAIQASTIDTPKITEAHVTLSANHLPPLELSQKA